MVRPYRIYPSPRARRSVGVSRSNVQAVPEFFVKFLTRPEDLVLGVFAESNVVGAVAERLARKWVSSEIDPADVLG